jgi:hypothetical protein
LRDGEVGASVRIKVRDSGSALFSIDGDATFETAHGLEFARTGSEQTQAAAGVVAGGFRFGGKEILTQKKILMTVPIEIGDTGGEGGGPLSRAGEHYGNEP